VDNQGKQKKKKKKKNEFKISVKTNSFMISFFDNTLQLGSLTLLNHIS